MNDILLKYGLEGLFISILIIAIKIMYNDNRKAVEKVSMQHMEERKESEKNVLEQFRKLFDEVREDKKTTREIIKNYSDDIRANSIILNWFKENYGK